MLHPQAQAVIQLVIDRGIPPVHTQTPEMARHWYRERRTFSQPETPAVASVQDLRWPGAHGDIPVRLVRPMGSTPEQALPVLVYFHGGGWVIGDLDTHHTLCCELANHSGCAVVSVDYRLAPEHRFPGAVDDCLAATRHVLQHGAALGLDAARMAIGGDSAGGNLAAVVALSLRDADRAAGAGSSSVKFQLLIYPATDQRCLTASYRTNGQGYLLTQDSMTYFHDHYLPDRRDDLDWRASPLLHADHSGLPAALVLTAGYDPLLDEGEQYADALTRAGTPATWINFPRQIHGFITMGRVLHEANDAVRLCAAAVRRALF